MVLQKLKMYENLDDKKENPFEEDIRLIMGLMLQ